MATATGALTTVDSDRPPPLPLDSIPIIDLSLLSQSELFSLSRCSNSSFDLNRCDDAVTPKIDPTVFNESAGSRKQTYSRLRLAPAQSPTSTKTTIHRRTPRLRSSHTPTPNNINGPEQAENSRIIHILKELFKSDHTFEDFVPTEVAIDTIAVVPELLSPLLSPETNRKRSRPQKNENDVFIDPPEAKRMRNDTFKKVVAYDDDGDTEIVNSRGVKVDLEKLGRLEDPYGLEIRRRTEGMSTKDELLGYLGGLHGEWWNTGKKKKIVDASVFGDHLPKGWRLGLSVKKKLGLVWLFCRPYISPSGRQFDSCKEVSTYLLSLLREKEASVIVNADVCEQKAKTKKPVVLALFSSLTRDFKKPVKSKIVGRVHVQVKKNFKCLKCLMIFDRKVKLLDHQVLAHRTETSTEISEWVVVKGGIFECQFCNNTFRKRKEYNEHIGTHETVDKKTAEVPKALTAEKTDVMESHDASFGDKPVSPSSHQSDDKIISGTEPETNEHVHDLTTIAHDNHHVHEETVNMNEDVLVEESGGEIEKKFDVDDIDIQSEAVNMNEDVLVEESGCEIEKKSNVDDIDNQEPVNMNEDVLVEESGGEIENTSNVDDIDDSDNMNEDVSVEESEKKCNVEDINNQGESDNMKEVEESVCEIENKSNVDGIDDNEGEPVSMNEDVLGEESENKCNVEDIDDQSEPVSMNEDALVEESCGEIETKCNVNDTEFPKTDEDPNVSVSESDVYLGHEASMSLNESNENIQSCVAIIDDCVDDKHNQGLDGVSGIVEKDIAGVSNGVDEVSETGVSHVDDKLEFIIEKEKTSENTPLLEPINVVVKSVTDEVVNLENFETRVQSPNEKKGFWEYTKDARISSLFDDLPDSETENLHLVSPSSEKQDSPQKIHFASVEDVTHDFEETKFSYGVNEHETHVETYNMSSINGVTSVEKEDNFTSVSPWYKKEHVEEPQTQTQMNMEDDDVINKSREINLDDFQIFTTDESVNNENTSVMGLEFNSLVPPVNTQDFTFQDDDVSGLYESGDQRGFLDHFSIPESYDDLFDENRSIGIHELNLTFDDEKKDGSKIDHTFDVQTDLSMVNNNTNLTMVNNSNLTMVNNIENLNVGRQPVNLPVNLPCTNETRAFSNIVYPDRTWEDEFRSNQPPQIGNGFIRVDEQQQRYNNNGFGLNGYRPGSSSSRSEPVELGFLSGRSEGGSSRVFPHYNNGTGIEQGFGGGYWNGKNVSGRNVISTSVCGWCRNVFHHVVSQIQLVGVASLCPSCSGQVNM